jgi:hypothetical protein
MSGNPADTAEQSDRSGLRVEFLKTLEAMFNKQCSIYLHGGFRSQGVVLASDRDIHHFCVKDFVTPTGVLPHSLVRITDIDSLSFSA